MNTATQAATHNADNLLDVQPLSVALAEMREHIAQTAPRSLALYSMFEPWVLAWAGNSNALTARAWLAERWKVFFCWRVDEILTDMQTQSRTPNAVRGFKDGLAQLRDIFRAFASHFVAKHPALTAAGRALGSLGFYLFLGALFLACQVIGLDLGDRLQALWRG